ncbi:hypothetical protein ABTA61_19315, partial [Acinetobacter baumannii]
SQNLREAAPRHVYDPCRPNQRRTAFVSDRLASARRRPSRVPDRQAGSAATQKCHDSQLEQIQGDLSS